MDLLAMLNNLLRLYFFNFLKNYGSCSTNIQTSIIYLSCTLIGFKLIFKIIENSLYSIIMFYSIIELVS
jgi:hypothetical protein